MNKVGEFEKSEVLDEFGATDCQKIVTDGLDHIVRWKGKGLREAIAGYQAPIRVRIYLRRAWLYAICFGS